MTIQTSTHSTVNLPDSPRVVVIESGERSHHLGRAHNLVVQHPIQEEQI